MSVLPYEETEGWLIDFASVGLTYNPESEEALCQVKKEWIIKAHRTEQKTHVYVTIHMESKILSNKEDLLEEIILPVPAQDWKLVILRTLQPFCIWNLENKIKNREKFIYEE